MWIAITKISLLFKYVSASDLYSKNQFFTFLSNIFHTFDVIDNEINNPIYYTTNKVRSKRHIGGTREI